LIPPPFHVVTGGPGAGKTTLVSALADAGFATVEEGARRIIRERRAATGRDPREDRRGFMRAMMQHDIAAWKASRIAAGPVFFDRGLPEVLGYCLLEGLDPPEELLSAIECYRYRPDVLIAPPWPEIYVRDSERIQSVEEAEQSYRQMRDIYPRCGYRLVELPRADVAARLAFVRSRIPA
jgi:predicted ATPase